MKETRTNMYKYYSSYVHNDFLSTFFGSFSVDSMDSSKETYFKFNLWGSYNYGGKELLQSVNKLIWISIIYFKYIITKPEYFKRCNHISKENYLYWNSGIIILFMLEKQFMRIAQ